MDGLIGVNSAALTAARVRGDHLQSGSMNRVTVVRDTDTSDPNAYRAEHPLLQTHPDSGRRGLYFSPAHTEQLKPLTVAESHPLLAYLTELATRPEGGCRFRWRPGALALWDNRCVLHRAVNDYDGYRRVMWRVTLTDLDGLTAADACS